MQLYCWRCMQAFGLELLTCQPVQSRGRVSHRLLCGACAEAAALVTRAADLARVGTDSGGAAESRNDAR